ncbi:uncharacterized protein [Tursiops truncatus]|uniref:uncharacterized protein isoform X1 n=1 Tax=Tursiops truncatus TaxID=9739 RepID=UPI003CCF3178
MDSWLGPTERGAVDKQLSTAGQGASWPPLSLRKPEETGMPAPRCLLLPLGGWFPPLFEGQLWTRHAPTPSPTSPVGRVPLHTAQIEGSSLRTAGVSDSVSVTGAAGPREEAARRGPADVSSHLAAAARVGACAGNVAQHRGPPVRFWRCPHLHSRYRRLYRLWLGAGDARLQVCGTPELLGLRALQRPQSLGNDPGPRPSAAGGGLPDIRPWPSEWGQLPCLRDSGVGPGCGGGSLERALPSRNRGHRAWMTGLLCSVPVGPVQPPPEYPCALRGDFTKDREDVKSQEQGTPIRHRLEAGRVIPGSEGFLGRHLTKPCAWFRRILDCSLSLLKTN